MNQKRPDGQEQRGTIHRDHSAQKHVSAPSRVALTPQSDVLMMRGSPGSFGTTGTEARQAPLPHFGLKDGSFEGELAKAKPAGIPFNPYA